MFRRFTAIVAATVVAFAILPVLAASAAVTGTGRITQAKDGFPGARAMAIAVTNSQPNLVGGAANYVEVVLPPNFSQASCPSTPAGTWVCSVVSAAGGGQTLVFQGGPLAGGATFTFPFGVQANRPASADSTGRFRVYLSDNLGNTVTEAQPAAVGALDGTIRILELLPGSLAATAPAGVVDQTGTAGQGGLTYTASVRNHARNAVNVTVAMSSNGDDAFSAPATRSASGLGATTAVPFTLALGTTAPNAATRTATFTAAATAAGATAQNAQRTFTVEAAPVLSLVSSSFSHPVVASRDGLTYTFTIDANKANLPGVDGLAGSLSFACATVNLASPASVARTAQNGVELTFGPYAMCPAADGTYDARFSFTGTDDNGKPYAQVIDVARLIEVDNLIPVVTLDPLAAPGTQDQVKDTDEVTVSGRVDDTAQRAPLRYVELQSTNGAQIPVTVTTASSGTGYTFTGTATLADLGDYGQLFAVAEACDRADNCGGATSNALDIDNVDPFLVDPGRVVQDALYAPRPVIEVTFSDLYTVRGACGLGNWSASGLLITEVLYSDGTPCTAAQASPTGDNVRILVPAETMDRDDTPQVTYTPRRLAVGVAGLEDPATDGALNAAADKVISTITGIAPPAPDLTRVLRNGGTEEATFDEDLYWTRFGGNDLVVEYTGFRDGYFVQVMVGDTVLRTEEADGSVVVPIGSTDRRYNRTIRLVNTQGLLGDRTPIAIQLDTVAAALTTASYVPGTATATFNEKLWAGSNFSRNWFVRELNPGYEPGYDDARYFTYRPDRVDGAERADRAMTIALPGNGDFAGVQYLFSASDGNARYVDRAGNVTGDQERA